ncbi:MULTISPECIES: LacI family DNA-binding transcriptional regulator [unclassified Plantactinospora]|uniref:LacI family DNA-binding transcriptional regulator n=1 Tax=unclassified Plantactinospora TaxID=2631981 RepID=UPI000D172D90|nr:MULTISPECIES: LacI family DNA-binding transcriptional regulator [unclassified Plantactinospora]AVT31617.1 LacI family transcriptional regulator [Plantactinospora sp. BC1]AVT37773.1 LacI family transcriptional regulator [Plantactinospora sp. BB1]
MARRTAEPAGGRRRSTIREVADRAGVSVATVSRILSGSYPAAPATRARVMRAVKELDYVANAHARALAGTPSKSVAIVLNSVISPHYAHVAQGVETQTAAEGRLCLIGTTGGDPERELAMVKFMREQHAEAVILVGNVVADEKYRERMSQYAHALAAIGSRLVLCGRPPLGPDVPAVVVEYDNAGGAFAATSHLLSAGHERILFVGRRPGYTTADGRLAGYRRALEAHRVPHDPALEVEGTMEWHEGYRMMKERLVAGPPDFTAVFCVNDLLAGGAHRALAEHGLRVPDDVSMVGFDDLPPSLDLGLTTVHLPHEEVGRTAVRLALEHEARGGTPPHVTLGTHLVVRDSVRPRFR